MSKNAILALDIGSNTIKGLIAERGEGPASGKVMLLSVITRPSRGIRRGVITDMDAAVEEIHGVLQTAREISKNSVRNIYLNIGGADVKSQVSKGIVAVSRASGEIHRDDVDRVLEASQAVNLPSNRMIIHTINREFIVDGVSVENPLGMAGARLEVVSFLIDAFKPNVKNLMKCVEMAGGGILALIFNPLASALAVLSKNQKELGVLVVDIGYGTTGMAVYEEGKLLHTKILPIGAGHITNDLAIALKIPVDIAERIKISHGYAVSHDVPAKETIDLKKIDATLKAAPSRRYISQVVESRLGELCELINEELDSLGKAGKLPGGVVITGGGAKLPGIAELFKSELKLTSKIGLAHPSSFEAATAETQEFLDSPEYAGALGLALWGLSSDSSEYKVSENAAKNIGMKVVNYLKHFLP